MKVAVYKTPKITSRSHDMFELLDTALPVLAEGCVVAVAAKIVSLCEGRVVPADTVDKDDLIRQQSQWLVPRSGPYNISFTITHKILLPTAGIDESNSNDHFILWPVDPQASANTIREHLASKHGLQDVGVIITDSTSRPMQRGTTGIAIAHSGFAALKDYVGQPDIFGRIMQFQNSNFAAGLAAAAVMMMGEGAEQTPIALLEDLPFIEFQPRNPSAQELENLRIDHEDDLFWPLLKDAPWEKGEA